jgi:GT2 family glycosyltransferase
MTNYDITVSLVLFHTNILEIENVLKLIQSSSLKINTYLIDNSSNNDLERITKNWDVIYIYNNANLGYGAGHNIAINMAYTESKYHLIINADIDFDPAVLKKSFDYMEANQDVGMLSPMIRHPNKEMLYYCRLLPTPFDLFARRFMPSFFKKKFRKRLDNYLLADKDYSKQMNIPNLPGCFMFIRTSVLKQIGGFDEKFFMYVEDIDLTRRLHKVSKTMYNPEIVIEHSLARGSYNAIKLTIYHMQSAIYYFNKWGWFVDKDRTKINRGVNSDCN